MNILFHLCAGGLVLRRQTAVVFPCFDELFGYNFIFLLCHVKLNVYLTKLFTQLRELLLLFVGIVISGFCFYIIFLGISLRDNGFKGFYLLIKFGYFLHGGYLLGGKLYFLFRYLTELFFCRFHVAVGDGLHS